MEEFDGSASPGLFWRRLVCTGARRDEARCSRERFGTGKAAVYSAEDTTDSSKPLRHANISPPPLTEPSQADVEVMDRAERTKLALALKAKGNKLYSSKRFAEAVVQYTKAIECEEQAVFYSNRAACESTRASSQLYQSHALTTVTLIGYTNLNELEKVVEDCTSALRLDPSYIKALNRRGTAREQIGGIESLYLALCGTSAPSPGPWVVVVLD